MTRITAPAEILGHAEDMMERIRAAQVFVRTYAAGGKTGVTSGVENTAWRAIDRAFYEARGGFAETIRATLAEMGPSVRGIAPAVEDVEVLVVRR